MVSGYSSFSYLSGIIKVKRLSTLLLGFSGFGLTPKRGSEFAAVGLLSPNPMKGSDMQN